MMALGRFGSACAIQTLLTLLSMGCGGSLDSGGAAAGDSGASTGDSGAAGTEAFPVGTYTTCVEGMHDNVLNTAGFQSGAVLTLTQSGGTLSAKYVDQNGATSSFEFASTTSTVGTLAPSGQTASGFSGMCVQGPGNAGVYPAVMTATAGALTYDEGTVFVMLEGAMLDDAGPCGAQSTPAAFWLLCEDRQGGAPSPGPAGATTTTSPPQLPVGPYTCSSQVETYDAVQGMGEYVAGGSNGTLTLTQTGADVTAQYTSDSAIGGTMLLTATTATTASPAASQSLTVPCAVPIDPSGAPPSLSPSPLPVAAGSLAVVGSTLFLSFAGTMDARSSCAGADVAGSLICTKQ
jgi:hypothetical protein